MPTGPTALLLGYVLFSGVRNTVLKFLQLEGAAHPINGENPISFCNVFFLSQLMLGLVLVLQEPATVAQELRTIDRRSRLLIAIDSFLGCFLAPLTFYLTLQQLSVITQTLLFSLSLPLSAFVAVWWLKERLPSRFWLSLGLILAGLIIGKVLSSGPVMGMDHLIGFFWGMVSVGATAVRNSLRQRLAVRQLSRGITSGVGNIVGALVFAVIALYVYGPQHFFYLRFWWVFWVIAVYGITLSLGTEVLRQRCARYFSVAQVALFGTASLVISIGSAALFLGEPLTGPVLLSSLLILAGVLQRFWPLRKATA
jgi:drug/metabolite transporter (DMT)-like permease